MYMIKAMDAGDIIAQEELPILPEDNTGSLFEKLSLLGRDLLLVTLPKLISGDVTPVPQDVDKVSFSPNIQPEEEILDFTKSAQVIHNKVEACFHFRCPIN